MEPILKSWPTQHARLNRHQTTTAVLHINVTATAAGAGGLKKKKAHEPKTKPNLSVPGRPPGAFGQALPACLQRDGGKARASSGTHGSADKAPPGEPRRGPGSAAPGGTGSGVGPSAVSGTATKWRPPLAAAPIRPRARRPPPGLPTARLGPVRSHRRSAAAVPPSPSPGMLRNPRTQNGGHRTSRRRDPSSPHRNGSCRPNRSRAGRD